MRATSRASPTVANSLTVIEQKYVWLALLPVFVVITKSPSSGAVILTESILDVLPDFSSTVTSPAVNDAL